MKLSEETIDELTSLLQQLAEIQIDGNEIDFIFITSSGPSLKTWTHFSIFANNINYNYDCIAKGWIINSDADLFHIGKLISIPSIEEQEIFLNLYNFMETHLIGSIERKDDQWKICGNSIHDTDIHLHIVQDILVKFAGKN